MHAHRIEVLDRADDDDVVRAIAHDLELELVPAAHRLLDEDLPDRRLPEAALDVEGERRRIVGEATAVATERERRTNDRGHGDAVELGERRHDHRRRHLEAA